MSDGHIEPDLIESITVEIESLSKITTPYSSGVNGRREARNRKVYNTFQIKAQVVFGNTEQTQHSTQLGTDEESAGYIIVRPKDLAEISKTIKRGDRFKKFIDDDGVETILPDYMYFVHSVGDLSAHTGSSGFWFKRLLFVDRKPVG